MRTSDAYDDRAEFTDVRKTMREFAVDMPALNRYELTCIASWRARHHVVFNNSALNLAAQKAVNASRSRERPGGIVCT